MEFFFKQIKLEMEWNSDQSVPKYKCHVLLQLGFKPDQWPSYPHLGCQTVRTRVYPYPETRTS